MCACIKWYVERYPNVPKFLNQSWRPTGGKKSIVDNRELGRVVVESQPDWRDVPLPLKRVPRSDAKAGLLGAARADIAKLVIVGVAFMAHRQDAALSRREKVGDAIDEGDENPFALAPRAEFGVTREWLDVVTYQDPIHRLELREVT